MAVDALPQQVQLAFTPLQEPLPSILAEDDEDRVFTNGEQSPSVSFDAQEDLDIPDFLKS